MIKPLIPETRTQLHAENEGLPGAAPADFGPAGLYNFGHLGPHFFVSHGKTASDSGGNISAEV
jgi:hypothetical protein